MVCKFGVSCCLSLFFAGIAQAQTAETENCIDLEQPVYQQLYQKQADGFNVPYCRPKDMTIYEQFSQWREVFGVPDVLVSMIYDYSTMVGSKAALDVVYEVSKVYDDGITTRTMGAIRDMGYPKFLEAYKNNVFARFDVLVQNSPAQAMFVEQWKNQLNKYTLALKENQAK